jgi:hypothetical protein
MTERILTRHPEGKNGVSINKRKYLVVREAILDSLQTNDVMSFKALMEDVEQRLPGTFEGSVSWYVTTVKLDLEAREEIERVPGSRPQQLRLAGEGQ